MFDTYVSSICSKYFMCFKRKLHSGVSCCKCFMCSESHRGTAGRRGMGCGEPGARRWVVLGAVVQKQAVLPVGKPL